MSVNDRKLHYILLIGGAVLGFAGVALWQDFSRNFFALPSPHSKKTSSEHSLPMPQSSSTPGISTQSDLIVLETPAPQALVKSPLSLSGRAKGPWYFEGSFVARIEDSAGNNLGVGIMQADGEWMVTGFVPFAGTIFFAPPTTATGKLILEKQNASGLPEHAARVEIPIRFR